MPVKWQEDTTAYKQDEYGELGAALSSIGADVRGVMSPPHVGSVLADAKKVFSQCLEGIDEDVLDVVFGTVLANQLQGDPVWIFLVGPPGDGKSEILRSLNGHRLIYALSSLSPNSLISGYFDEEAKTDPSLLPLLDEKVLVIKDFTAILDLPAEARSQILGTLRDAFDGEAAKAFGSVGTRSYVSHFGIIAGVTPAIENQWSISAQLGERFLKLRLTGGDREAKTLRALRAVNTENSQRESLREAAHEVLGLFPDPPVMDEIATQRVLSLALFVATARSVVNRDSNAIIKGIPVTEVPTRVGKSLKKLAMGIAMAREKAEVGEAELRIITRIALDTVPSIRADLLAYLYRTAPALKTGAEIADELRMPTSSATRHLEDMQLLGMTERSGKQQVGYTWRLTSAFRTQIRASRLFSATEDEGEGGG